MSQHAGDRRLAERMLDGDERAFGEFFEVQFSFLYRYALPRLDWDEDDAEEVAQATLCRAVSKLAGYRGRSSLATWLCTFCRHELSAHYRRRARRGARRLDEASGSTAESRVPTTGPQHELERREVSAMVLSTLERLPPHYADALEWKYVDDLPVKEIAERLGRGPKAAESLLTRARQAFRDAYAGTRVPSPESPRRAPVAGTAREGGAP